MIDLELLERAVKKVWYTRTEDEDAVHSHVISELGILDLITRLRQAEQDAARYQWLREQHWNDSDLCVVSSPKESVKLGYDCPSGDRLDVIIDGAMK